MIRATGAAFNIHDMFMNFPYKKLKISCLECEKITKKPHRDILVKRVFRECLKLVLEDIIDNNVTFLLPTGKKKCDIHMLRFKDDAFRNLKKAGKWSDVGLVASNFTGHQLGLYMYGKGPARVKSIYVNKRLKDKITQYTNEGKQYC